MSFSTVIPRQGNVIRRERFGRAKKWPKPRNEMSVYPLGERGWPK
jgi:hypothetical protein